LFRQEKVPHRELMQDGQKVLLQGEVTVYEARGQYQMLVRAVELQGVGALQLKFEQLKQKLAAAGWFAAARKRPLPRYPQRIGLVTSATGAAIRDVLHVLQRRHPGLEIILAPCRVQGDGAAREIAAAIRLLNDWHKSEIRNPKSEIDLILVTRGGGSLEDLWAFNEEIVAQAIFESALPVVSAVGHEIDFTIADFVADVRAATPSAAAEIITEGLFASREFVADAARAMRLRARQAWENSQADLERLAQRLARVHPQRWLAEQAQRLDDLSESLSRYCWQAVRERRVAAENLVARLRLVRPGQFLRQQRERLQQSRRRLLELGRTPLRDAKQRLATLESRLRLLGPEQVLARGYSITMDAATGEILRNAQRIKPGQRLRTRLKTGEVHSQVEESRGANPSASS
jgi:exodeoxyribonuclease VII large subunit